MSLSKSSFLERGGDRVAVNENGTRVAFFHRRRDPESNRLIDELMVLSIGENAVAEHGVGPGRDHGGGD